MTATQTERGAAFFLNSFLGRKGNIGLRFTPVIGELQAQGWKVGAYCRGGERVDGIAMHTMGPLGHVPRLLSALRIYVAPALAVRRYDIALYEAFFRQAPNGEVSPSIAHIAEYAPKLIDRLRVRGIPVVLDVPIAPQCYVARMRAADPSFPLVPDKDIQERELACCAKADLILCPSPFVAGELSAAGVSSGRICVIPFGAAYDGWSKRDSPPKGRPLEFCFAGNVSPRKGVLDLLAAWARPEFRAHRLHLCGRVYPEIARALARHGFGNVVTPGFVDVDEYFKRCDVFVLPSLMEGSSKAVYEAMNRSLPVVVTRETGSVARDGIEGYVVPARDPEALASAMLRFADTPGLAARMGAAAKARMAGFTWADYGRRVVAAYDRLLGA